MPTGTIGTNAATDAIRSGMTNITGVNNRCNRVDDVGASQNYQGDTNNSADIGQGYCFAFSAKDGKNTWSFGNQEWSSVLKVLAATCNWSVVHDGPNKIVETDIEINHRTQVDWTDSGGSSSCSGEWDMEAVMTHESGHVFGLGHVGSAAATMFYDADKCDIRMRTLAFGDVLGLRQRY